MYYCNTYPFLLLVSKKSPLKFLYPLVLHICSVVPSFSGPCTSTEGYGREVIVRTRSYTTFTIHYKSPIEYVTSRKLNAF